MASVNTIESLRTYVMSFRAYGLPSLLVSVQVITYRLRSMLCHKSASDSTALRRRICAYITTSTLLKIFGPLEIFNVYQN